MQYHTMTLGRIASRSSTQCASSAGQSISHGTQKAAVICAARDFPHERVHWRPESVGIFYLYCCPSPCLSDRPYSARDILERGKVEFRGDWKINLEIIMLEYRAGNIRTAIKLARNAVTIYPGAGRLWAILIALSLVCKW